jgi:hypothetical protein
MIDEKIIRSIKVYILPKDFIVSPWILLSNGGAL